MGLSKKIMLELFNKEKEYPVFNLEIARSKEKSLLRECDETSQYIGEFTVYNVGRLERKITPALHAYEATLEYGDDHIHLRNRGGMINIITKDSKPFLVAEFETPQFTLDGLYSLAHPKASEKPELLIEYIKQFNPKFQFNSIATREDTRLNLL